MSLPELTRPPGADVGGAGRGDEKGGRGQLLASELRVLFGRARTLSLLAVLALVPIGLGLAVRLSNSQPDAGEGPPFITRVTGNGLFLTLTSLAVVVPFFLPLTISVAAGDAVAGEASTSTLRYLLVAPVRRPKLLVVKYTAVIAFVVVAALLVAVIGLAVGAALFGLGDVTLISGQTVGLAEGIGRAGLVAGYVALSMTGLAAIGLFISTLTDVPVGAMVATVAIAIVAQILDAIPQIAVLHPYLLSHYWLAFVEFLRSPVVLGEVWRGLALQAGYVAIFGSLAWARFTTKDILS